MRFLIDAQLPPALARLLASHGHAAEHVADIGLRDADDSPIELLRRSGWASRESPGLSASRRRVEEITTGFFVAVRASVAFRRDPRRDPRSKPEVG